MKNPFRRHHQPQHDLATELTEAAASVAQVLTRFPVKIQHDIIRHPAPRPTTISFSITNNEGQRYMLMPMDVSYKHSVPVVFSLSWVTGNPADAGAQVRIDAELHYDPQNRYPL